MSNVTHEALATTKCLEHVASRGVIDFEDGYCGKQMQQSFAEQCKVTMLVISMSCLAYDKVNVRQLVEKRHDEALRGYSSSNHASSIRKHAYLYALPVTNTPGTDDTALLKDICTWSLLDGCLKCF